MEAELHIYPTESYEDLVPTRPYYGDSLPSLGYPPLRVGIVPVGSSVSGVMALAGNVLGSMFRRVGVDAVAIMRVVEAREKEWIGPVIYSNDSVDEMAIASVGRLRQEDLTLIAKAKRTICTDRQNQTAWLARQGARADTSEEEPWSTEQFSEAITTATFQRLKEQWYHDTALVSSGTKILNHPAYQQIIKLGPSVVPLIIEELRQGKGHWFYALSRLTGYVPAQEHRGNMGKMQAAWLQWAEEHLENFEERQREQDDR